jgi:hypothetical protein
MNTSRLSIASVVLTVCCSIAVYAVSDSLSGGAFPDAPTVTLLTSGLEGALGSTLGPGGALYVAESAAGRIARVDPQTGEVTVFATGLPKTIPAVGLGGVVDVVFVGNTVYALTTLVGPDVGGQDVAGIYRVDGPGVATPIADIGEFSITHPPDTPFFVPSGVQYALDPYRGCFLVTDGHHNRVLQVARTLKHGIESGDIKEFRVFDNIVPTGLAISGKTVYMAEAGPAPHLPKDGRIVSFGAHPSRVNVVASGARLLVDVEFGRGHSVFGLSQGVFPEGAEPGSPALPDTGALVKAGAGGKFVRVIENLDRPTSLEIIGNTAYVVTLGGEVWRIDGLPD